MKFKSFKITKELWCSPKLSANAKMLLAYLIMCKKRILYAGTHYLADLTTLSKTTISNLLHELEDRDYISIYAKPDKKYNLTIIHDKAFNEFNYSTKTLTNNWNYISDVKAREIIIKRATVDTLELFKKVYTGGAKDEEDEN